MYGVCKICVCLVYDVLSDMCNVCVRCVHVCVCFVYGVCMICVRLVYDVLSDMCNVCV